jgi:hypothetical protein
MIAIKTMMRRMPERCGECERFLPSEEREYPVCSGAIEYGFSGMTFKSVRENLKRPSWCPLVEVEVADG